MPSHVNTIQNNNNMNIHIQANKQQQTYSHSLPSYDFTNLSVLARNKLVACGDGITHNNENDIFHIILIVGTRPNYMKVAPIFKELKYKYPNWSVELVHTGQHYSPSMYEEHFTQLGLPIPNIYLDIGKDITSIEQMSNIMIKLEKHFEKHTPDIVIVVGDVTSTLATALVASKISSIILIHVESGLRSFDRNMPEEVNRVITDAVSDIHFVTEQSGVLNLWNEGISRNVFLVGNTMIDSLKKHINKATALNVHHRLGLHDNEPFVVVTIHRPSNVDNPIILDMLFDSLNTIAKHLKVIFPIHPRTEKKVKAMKLDKKYKNVIMINPLAYIDFLGLVIHSTLVITDSGGIQEEAAFLNIPCITVRENTERPITISQGTNQLVAIQKTAIVDAAMKVLQVRSKRKIHDYNNLPVWDGKASERIVDILYRLYKECFF